MKKPRDEYISLQEAAMKAGMHQDFFRSLCNKGRLKGKKIGRNWVTTLRWVKEYLDSRKMENIPKKYRDKA